MRKFTLILFVHLFSSLTAQETIETDRPDQTETPSVTPAGFLQIETGFLYEKLPDGAKSASHPTVLWRYGLNDHFEVRMVTELNSEKFGGDLRTGLAPIVFGFKAKLIQKKEMMPAVSFVGHLAAGNLASPDMQTENWAPSFRFLIEHSLSEKLGLSYNLGAEWNGETPDATSIYTIAASYAFAPQLSMFAEFYGFLNKNSGADHRFDSGFTYLLNNNLMLDASAGVGLSEVSPNYFISTGVSYRFPLR